MGFGGLLTYLVSPADLPSSQFQEEQDDPGQERMASQPRTTYELVSKLHTGGGILKGLFRGLL